MRTLPGAGTGTKIQSCILLRMQNTHAHTLSIQHPVKDSPCAPVMKLCVLHSRSATEPTTQSPQQRTPLCSPAPFLSPPSSPFPLFLPLISSSLAPSLPPSRTPDKKPNCRCHEMSKDNLTWGRKRKGKRDGEREQEGQIERVRLRKRKTGRRGSNCVLVSAQPESLI